MQANNAQIVPPGKRPCPICGQAMAVESYCDVAIDVCRAHGMWLDNSELRTILGKSQSKAQRLNLESLKRARRDSKVSGMLLGAWSLLLD